MRHRASERYTSVLNFISAQSSAAAQVSNPAVSRLCKTVVCLESTENILDGQKGLHMKGTKSACIHILSCMLALLTTSELLVGHRYCKWGDTLLRSADHLRQS